MWLSSLSFLYYTLTKSDDMSLDGTYPLFNDHHYCFSRRQRHTSFSPLRTAATIVYELIPSIRYGTTPSNRQNQHYHRNVIFMQIESNSLHCKNLYEVSSDRLMVVKMVTTGRFSVFTPATVFLRRTTADPIKQTRHLRRNLFSHSSFNFGKK